jgi:hypothetical protein
MITLFILSVILCGYKGIAEIIRGWKQHANGRKLFLAETYEGTGKCRTFPKEMFHDLYM